MKFIEGTDYDRKLDEMIESLEKSGLSEREILQKMMGDKNLTATEQADLEGKKAEEEIFFDPSLLDMDGALFREFTKVIETKKNDPELQEMMRQLAE